MVFINAENYQKIRNSQTKRIRFLDQRVINTEVDPNGRYAAFLNVPFCESISPIIQSVFPRINFRENHNSGRFYYGIESDDETKQIELWIASNKRHVFIKSCLDSVVALDMTYESGEELIYTDIGRHEHSAKEHGSESSIQVIGDFLCSFVENTPYYATADCVVCVPPSTGRTDCLAGKLARCLSEKNGFVNYSNRLQFLNKTKSLQSEAVDDKWAALSESGLAISEGFLFSGKKIIIIDDLYQSGSTMHYVAKRLQEVGAGHILGLTVVKSRRDDDNSGNQVLAMRKTKDIKGGPAFSPVIFERESDGYPEKLFLTLKDKAPQRLWCLGNTELLKMDSVGFCGSRNVTEKGLEIARDCATQAVSNEKVVVSGNARGVDRIVHYTALCNFGFTILVLPEGIDNFRIVNDLQDVWDWKRVLVVSEFAPDVSWKSWNAMKRNKTILGLVSAMIVIEAGEKGGTISAGKDALKIGTPLFVVNRTDFEFSKGSKILLENGGIKLNKSGSKNIANFHPVLDKMNQYNVKVRVQETHLQLI